MSKELPWPLADYPNYPFYQQLHEDAGVQQAMEQQGHQHHALKVKD